MEKRQQTNLFYDTVGIKKEDLKRLRESNKSQNDRILEFLKTYPTPRTAEEIHKLVFGNSKTPLTSVRRALSTLKDRGDVVKLEQTKPGKYGVPVHLYQYK